jgi:hypothetical protein
VVQGSLTLSQGRHGREGKLAPGMADQNVPTECCIDVLRLYIDSISLDVMIYYFLGQTWFAPLIHLHT